MMKTRKLLTLCCLIVISCTLILNSAYAVQNIQKDGYTEQILNDGSMQIHNYLVTDWSQLESLPDTSEGECDVFLCLIAAQMLDLNMTWEDYFKALEEKGINYDKHELSQSFSVGDNNAVIDLNFSPKVTLTLVGDPIVYAIIFVESPYEYGGFASVPVDIEHTMTPYSTLTDEGQLVDAP